MDGSVTEGVSVSDPRSRAILAAAHQRAVEADRDGRTVVRWATVVSLAPLRVRYDGESAPSNATPSLVGSVREGDRVLVVKQGVSPVIIGGSGGGDTGWLDLPYAEGFTATTVGQLAYRREGSRVWIRGGAYGTFTAGSYIQPHTGTIPVVHRIGKTSYVGTMGDGMRGYCGIQVTAAGQVRLGFSAGGVGLSSPVWISAECSYLVG